MAISLPRIDACGLGLAPVWFSKAAGDAYPCGRVVRLDLNQIQGGNFSPTAQVTVHIAGFGSTLKAEWTRASAGSGPLTVNVCQSHPYITHQSGGYFHIDAVAARIAAAWSSSEVITITVSSYLSYNTAFSRSCTWGAHIYPYDGSDSPTPPTSISDTQNFNDNQSCSGGTPAAWGTLTIDEDGTLTLA